jgi:histidine triad (HIT) family protein
MNTDDCRFCAREFEARILFECEYVVSFVSRPWFRQYHCLVIPKRHVVTATELTEVEGSEIMKEIGRLSAALNTGHGTGVMQKYQPLQTENGIKVNHLHFHIFPRFEAENELFPVPTPNSFDGFSLPSNEEIQATITKAKAQ